MTEITVFTKIQRSKKHQKTTFFGPQKLASGFESSFPIRQRLLFVKHGSCNVDTFWGPIFVHLSKSQVNMCTYVHTTTASVHKILNPVRSSFIEKQSIHGHPNPLTQISDISQIWSARFTVSKPKNDKNNDFNSRAVPKTYHFQTPQKHMPFFKTPNNNRNRIQLMSKTRESQKIVIKSHQKR